MDPYGYRLSRWVPENEMFYYPENGPIRLRSLSLCICFPPEKQHKKAPNILRLWKTSAWKSQKFGSTMFHMLWQ